MNKLKFYYSLLLKLFAMFVLTVAATAVELPAPLVELAAALKVNAYPYPSPIDPFASPHALEVVPEVSIPEELLEQIATNANLSAYDRMAALFLLGESENERTKVIRDYFDATSNRAVAWHVPRYGTFLQALEPASISASPIKIFLPSDIPFLVHEAVANRSGLATAALAYVDDVRVPELLVFLPESSLGIHSPSLANYHGLRILCNDPEYRKQVVTQLDKLDLYDPRRVPVILALASAQDQAALEPLANLLDRLAERAKSRASAPSSFGESQAPIFAILPRSIDPCTILSSCGEWGDPIFYDPIRSYIYAGGECMGQALSIANAYSIDLDKEKLFDLVKDANWYLDPFEILRTLSRSLTDDDAQAVASLLAREEWNDSHFFRRVIWINGLPNAVLSGDLRTALITLSVEHKKQAVQEWAVEALRQFDDPISEAAIREAEDRGSIEAIRILCRRDPDPAAAFNKRLTSENPVIKEAAYRLIEKRFNNGRHGDVPGELVADQRTSIAFYIVNGFPPESAEAADVRLACSVLPQILSSFPTKGRAQWTPELSDAVTGWVTRVYSRDDGSKYYSRLLKALEWADSENARSLVEQVSMNEENQQAAERAKKCLEGWASRSPHR